MATPPVLLTDAGPSFGDGAFQPGDHVTIHGVNNLEEGLRAKVIAWAPADALYVVNDAAGNTWGLRAEKLQPMATLVLDPGGTWSEVPMGVAVPAGAELRIDLGSAGKRYARLLPTTLPGDGPGSGGLAGSVAPQHAVSVTSNQRPPAEAVAGMRGAAAAGARSVGSRPGPTAAGAAAADAAHTRRC